jgi:hypothetical protein
MNSPSRAQTGFLAGVTFALAAALLAGCSAGAGDSANVPVAAPQAFEHIHALTVDPNNGDLIVATHEGLYELVVGSDGATTADGPVGGLDFDLMGFTLIGNTAYASGHPGATTPDSFGTPNLGLISSIDRGKTWVNVSRAGQTDFHALTVAPSGEDASAARIFGLDSSKLAIQRSLDGGISWTDGAELVARDIVADPARPGTIFATTENGLAVSSDNASSFEIVPGAPALYLLTISSDTHLLAGIDTSGMVWKQNSADEWVRGGSVSGTPQAVTVFGSRLYVADDSGIAFSDDEGTSWTVIKILL